MSSPDPPHPMDTSSPEPLATLLAGRLRGAREELGARWLDRIAARVTLEPERLFPSRDLLDHVPLVIAGIADCVENPAEEIGAQAPVVSKAMELGELRHAQGFDAHEILKEYELLGGVIFAYLARVVETIEQPYRPSELLRCLHRAFRALEAIQQVTMMHFLRLGAERVREREERLRGFNRMLSHELKNHVAAILGAQVLLVEGGDGRKRERFLAMIGQNAEAMRVLLENLSSLSRLDPDARGHRNVPLASAVHEAVRQLRELARARGVTVSVARDLPAIEVNAAAVELCLANYLSNAIKYSDPEKPERWVRVHGRVREGLDDAAPCELVVEVCDNGLGVPAEARGRLFERFFRAHEESAPQVEGTGVGLSIVRDTVRTLGGNAWAEFRDGETAFALSLPYRRAEDVAGRGLAAGARDTAPGGRHSVPWPPSGRG